MANRRFRRREPLRKLISCSCGSDARIVRRRNFPFGRKSSGKTIIVYKCKGCKKEYPLIKTQEVKR